MESYALMMMIFLEIIILLVCLNHDNCIYKTEAIKDDQYYQT